MPNSVNGLAAITANTERELTGVDPGQRYQRVVNGQVHRARLILDTAADFNIDSPIVGVSGYPAAGMRIFPVGIEMAAAAACVITFKSKVGAAAAINLGSFDLAAKTPLFLPIDVERPFSVTDPSGVLIVNASSLVNVTLYYIIADKMIAL